MDNGQISGSFFALDAVCAMAILGLMFAWSYRRAKRHMAPSITSRLRESGQPYRTRLAFLDQTWNPTPGPGRYKLIGPGTPIMGPGVAVYSLDESGNVRLSFTPKGGTERQFIGPMPPDVQRPSVWHATHGLARWILILDAALVISGAVVGLASSSGSVLTRVGGASLGFFIGLMATVVVSRIFMIIVSTRLSPKSPSRSALNDHGATPAGEAGGADELLRRYEKERRIAQGYLDEHDRTAPPP